ncbi:MAG: hypothetical protein HZA46_17230 [Planctomycetales bacterium]|nr:hypothetical protein [Planctomycetales bacterium]
MMLRRPLTMAMGLIMVTMSHSAANAQLGYVPNKLQINGPVSMSGGSTAYGDWLRGEGHRNSGLGQMYSGMGGYLQGLGDYEMSHQRARSMSLQNNQVAMDAHNRKKENHVQDVEGTKQANLERNLNKHWSQTRDRPTLDHVSSGQTFNQLLKDMQGRLTAADFANVRLTQEELSGIRLATAHGLTRGRVFELLDEAGAVRWPTSLRRPEFRQHRAAVDESTCKLLAVEPGSTRGKELLSKWDAELKSLRDSIGFLNKSGNMIWYEAKQFIEGLQALSQCMRTHEFEEAFNGTLDVQPQTASELVEYMSQHKLRFAASDGAGTAAYRELHRVLAECHRRIVPAPGKNLIMASQGR